jgi:S1-C subfamily serine protease
VESATEGETAAQAGIQPKDVIIAANGESFVGVEGMKEIFYDVGVGNEVILTVLRGMEELEIPVLLIE